LSAELLGRLQVQPRSFSLFFCRTLMSSDIAEALPDREFLDFGGPFMGSAGLIVAIQFAVARFLVTLLSKLGVLSGTLQVLLGDRLPGGKCLPPTQQLLGARGGLLTP
jgi:hypothetical protein